MVGIILRRDKQGKVKQMQPVPFFNAVPVPWDPTLTAFSFTATEGQSRFTLDDFSESILWVAVNGKMIGPSLFSNEGKTLILSNPVHSGDKVFGIYLVNS